MEMRENSGNVQERVLVSVIIPVYNAEKYIRKCLESLIDQTFQDFEGIIVNDGSTDDSRNIIVEYIKNFPEKFRVYDKENGGQSSARNLGLEKASGKYVTFLDADDYIKTDYLERLAGTAEKNNCDVVFSGQYKVKEDGRVIKSIIYHPKDGKCLSYRLNISGKIYRADYIDKWKVRFPVGKIYEENSFNFQMLFLSDRNYFLEYAGYYQVVHEGSTTSKYIEIDKLPLEEWERCISKILKNIKEEQVRQLFEFTVISFFTYFLLVRNRKREYLSNVRKRKNDGALEMAKYFENMINTYFPEAIHNRYASAFKYRELMLKQKIGVKVFAIMCHKKKLVKFTKAFYYVFG